MQLHDLRPSTPRKDEKRVGRGGKRGTTSGAGTKGQKSRAGAGVKPGFRGGDNRIWQLFPKQRGASKKPGNAKPHRKHRFFHLRHAKVAEFNLDDFNSFENGQVVTLKLLRERGLTDPGAQRAKVLGTGELKKKLTFEGLAFSASARKKAEDAGSVIHP